MKKNFLILLNMCDIGHHRICRTRSGSNDRDTNIMEVDRHKEQKMHNHYGVRLFHEKLIDLIDNWHSTDVIGEVKNKVHGLIGEYGPDMYERRAIKNFDQFAWNFDRKHGVYVPKPYREDGRY